MQFPELCGFLHSPSSWRVEVTNAQLAKQETKAIRPKRLSEDVYELMCGGNT